KKEWAAHKNERVNPSLFFDELRRQLRDDAVVTVDDGNHTFLAAELFEVRAPRTFVSPTDSNCMGYCVPPAIGAKLVNPTRRAVADGPGDGPPGPAGRGRRAHRLPQAHAPCPAGGQGRAQARSRRPQVALHEPRRRP